MPTKTKLTQAQKNAAFKRLKPAQQRVRIAKDVLKQLDLKKIIPKEGTYVSLGGEGLFKKGGAVKQGDLQSILCGKDVESCHVCALGSVFVGAVRLADEVRSNVLYNGEEHVGGDAYEPIYARRLSASGVFVRDYLSRFFTDLELDVMESYFETSSFSRSPEGDKICEEAAKRGERVAKPETRMRRLMQSIVDNRGKLVMPGTKKVILEPVIAEVDAP